MRCNTRSDRSLYLLDRDIRPVDPIHRSDVCCIGNRLRTSGEPILSPSLEAGPPGMCTVRPLRLLDAPPWQYDDARADARAFASSIPELTRPSPQHTSAKLLL